jgi:hypothetical protein
MKLAVVGSRTFNNYDLLKKEIDEIRKQYNITEIVSGGANGADKLAEKYARENNLKITIFPALWNKYGKRAGFIRNEKIWQHCDLGIAFWDGESKGTKHSFLLSKKYNKYLKIIKFKRNTNV